MRYLFWLCFLAALVVRLNYYASHTPLRPTFKNSETLFRQYYVPRSKKEIKSPHSLRRFPSLNALYEAVWKGDLSFFPKEVREFYLYSGTLPVLALSAQHIWVLVSLWKILQYFVAKFLFVLSPTLYWRVNALLSGRRSKDFLFFACSLLLVVTSEGNSSALRAFALYGAFYFTRSLCLSCTKIQALCTSAALLLFFDPSWGFQIGFVLSFIGVFLLFIEKEKAWGFLMPLFFLPWLSYFFGGFSFLTILVSFPVMILWNVVWIPLGFLLPIFFHKGGEMFFLPFFEKTVALFFHWHNWSAAIARSSYIRVAVLTEWEVFLLEIWILGGALYLIRALKKRAEEGIAVH